MSGFVCAAIEAVPDDRPDAAVEIAEGTWVRAMYLAEMLLPEALRRSQGTHRSGAAAQGHRGPA